MEESEELTIDDVMLSDPSWLRAEAARCFRDARAAIAVKHYEVFEHFHELGQSFMFLAHDIEEGRE